MQAVPILAYSRSTPLPPGLVLSRIFALIVLAFSLADLSVKLGCRGATVPLLAEPNWHSASKRDAIATYYHVHLHEAVARGHIGALTLLAGAVALSRASSTRSRLWPAIAGDGRPSRGWSVLLLAAALSLAGSFAVPTRFSYGWICCQL